MMDERLAAQASLYALGALTADEAIEFESQMAGDAALQNLVRELRHTAQSLVMGFPRVAPPADVKQSVLAAVPSRARNQPAGADSSRPPGWYHWMPWAMAACFAVLCVALISVGHKLRRQAESLNADRADHALAMAELQHQLAQAQVAVDTHTSNYEHRLAQNDQRAAHRLQDVQRQAGVLTNQLLREQAGLRSELQTIRERTERLTREKQVLEEAIGGSALAANQRLTTARMQVLRPTPDGSPRAVGAAIWLATDQRGLLVAESMPPPHTSQDYQLWLLDPNSPSPVSGGVFRPDTTGLVRLEFRAPNLGAVDRFAVTLEPKGGSTRPTGKLVLSSP